MQQKKELEDQITLLETEIKDLNNKTDETEYELDKIRDKAFKLDRQLAETLVKLSNIQKQSSSSSMNVNHHLDQNGHIIYHNNINQNSNSTNSSNNSANRSNNLSDKQVRKV